MSLNNDTTEKATILVVDDTPDNLTIMSNLLEDKYTVKVANRGEKGLKIARSDSPPDLILLDIMMPEMDGYEVCKLLKADPKTADIPIIFLTAKNEADDEISGFTLGAVDYITKPIQADVTLARIQRHLAIKKVQDKQREIAEKLRKQLVHMQKISSMGQMTEGVAHEFNNILCGILGYTGISKMIIEDIQNDKCKDDLGESLNNVEQGVQKATSLIDKMLIYCNQHNFSVGKVSGVRPTVDVINEVLVTQDEDVKIELDLLSNEKIEMDATALHQVLENLLKNAVYAIEDNPEGVIKISLKATHLTNDISCLACAKCIDAECIELNVSDNGAGMDLETMTKMFDPFFTTKEVGEGVGLGLSVVSGFVHQANGHIFVDSKLGIGTEFRLLFPVLSS
jgi:C4-dicarboxylate-specific signal transduction histidine kinase